MNDDVTGVDQHPVAMRHALDARVRNAGFFQALQNAIGDGADMAVRPAAGDHHGVGECSLAATALTFDQVWLTAHQRLDVIVKHPLLDAELEASDGGL